MHCEFLSSEENENSDYPITLRGRQHLLSFLASLGGVNRQHVTAATAHLQLALIAVPVETQVPANLRGVQQVERVTWEQFTWSV